MACSSSSSVPRQSALYVCAQEDDNGAFQKTCEGFKVRVEAAAKMGLSSDCKIFESIHAVDSYIKDNYPNGLARLYIRAHGDQADGRGVSLTLKSRVDGGIISRSSSVEQLKRVCQAVQPGGTLIVEGCYAGLGNDNLLKYLASLCQPNVLVVGSKGSYQDVEFHPLLNMHTRFTDEHTKEDLTRIYYTKSGKAKHIPVDQFNILWNFLRASIPQDDHQILQKVYRLCYQLLRERNNPEVLNKIKDENKALIASLLPPFEEARTTFQKMSFSKKDASPVWQEILTELENASHLFDYEGEKELSITAESKAPMTGSGDRVSFHRHARRYIAAYRFLLACAAIEKYMIIGVLYDDGDSGFCNPGVRIMNAISDQSVHTDELSLCSVLSSVFPIFKESYLLAKKHSVLQPGLITKWLTDVIGAENGACLNKYIEMNNEFYYEQLAVESNLGLKNALRKNDLEAFKRHLQNGAELNHICADGRTIWSMALEENSPIMIAHLVLAFRKECFHRLLQDIQDRLDPAKKVRILSAIYNLLLKEELSHKEESLLNQELLPSEENPLESIDLTRPLEQAIGEAMSDIEARPDSLSKAMDLHHCSVILDEIGEGVRAEQVRKKIFDILTYGKDISSHPCTFDQIQELLNKAQSDEDAAFLQMIRAIPSFSHLYKQSPAAIRTWLNDPANFHRINRITYLNLNHKGLKILPEEIGLFRGLQDLYLNYNQLTSLPNSIGNLRGLRILGLSYNQLTSLPDSIGSLPVLELLDFNNNQLTSLPDSIGSVRCLRLLYLSNNQLTSLPNSIGNLRGLRILCLSYNQLTSLPDSIGSLPVLEHLDFHNNQLTFLPDSIGSMRSLRSLFLSNNQLTFLPDSIGSLTALHNLVLDGNQLTFLPDSIGSIHGLQTLSLSNNQLTLLPDSILRLSTRLQLLSEGNPWIFISDKELEKQLTLKTFFGKYTDFKEYPAASCLAQLFQLIAENNDLNGIQNTFEKLEPDFQQRISELANVPLVIQESSSSSSSSTVSFKSVAINPRLFHNIPALARAVRSATFEKFASLSEELKERVYAEIYRLEGKKVRKNLIWGRGYVFDKMLHFVDALGSVVFPTSFSKKRIISSGEGDGPLTLRQRID